MSGSGMRRQAGFTLIEIMMVIAIIGILSAVAIPRFIDFQLRSRTVEPRLLLAEIQKAMAQYRATNDCYMDVALNPPALPPGNGALFDATKSGVDPCTPGGTITFQDLDLDIGGVLYYQYECAALAVGNDSGFACDAEADLDADGAPSTWVVCSDNDEDNTCDGPTNRGNVAPIPWYPIRVSAERF